MKHYGDITKIKGNQIPVVDCITGGSPCQDLSTAGKRAGLDGARSGLFMEQIRIVKEMREHDKANGRTDNTARPRFMVWENVPGAFSSNGGKDFQAVLSEIVKIAEPSAPDVPLSNGGKWSKSGCLYDAMGNWSIAWRVHDAQFWGVPQRRKRIALVADFGGLAAPEVCFERESLQRNFEESNRARKDASSSTIESVGETDGKGVVFGISSFNSNAMKSSNPKSGIYKAETSRTIDLKGGNPACNQGGMIVLEGNGSSMYTLNSTEQHAVLYDAYQHHGWRVGETCGTLTAGQNDGVRGDTPLITDEEAQVRRLTPMECERLQGFPDGWTEIGEWTDTKGKRHKPTDAPRYKALGNSIALPFWFWLLRRISAQYERPATLGSLFDGIGGFPLCWERCNGKGTALWASEIEEFPIAVTKLRFPED